jgi:hypothetical protein
MTILWEREGILLALFDLEVDVGDVDRADLIDLRPNATERKEIDLSPKTADLAKIDVECIIVDPTEFWIAIMKVAMLNYFR